MKKQASHEQYEQLQREIEEYKGKYLRALADYQNLERRVKEEREAQTKYASQKIVYALLEIFDIFEKVWEHNKSDEGLKLGINGFWEVLSENGVKKIETAGKKFDPYFMECTEVVESDKDDIVIEEVRSGYSIKDKVLRVAQVKVGKKTENLEAEQTRFRASKEQTTDNKGNEKDEKKCNVLFT